MPRRVQDIIPNKNRSIRDIPVERNNISVPIEVPKKRDNPVKLRSKISEMRQNILESIPEKIKLDENIIHKIEKGEKLHPDHHKVGGHISLTPPKSNKLKRSKKWIYILMGLLVLVAGIGYIASVYFSRASFVIVPITLPISVNSNYVASSDDSKDLLIYDIITVRGSATTTVVSTDGPNTTSTAKGSITIYNSYSKDSQQLVAGTRFSDSSGRVYRLTSSVSIPGYTMSGENISPGVLTTTVAADQIGPSYNISKNNFKEDLKIVAYKGTPRYETMYGRVATDINGGFNGFKKIVSATILETASTELQSEILSSLVNKVISKVPEGYIMYDNGYVVTFSEPAIVGGEPKSAIVTMDAVLHGILFKKENLVNKIAGIQKISAFSGFSYEPKGLRDLNFSIANAKDFSPEKKNTLIIKLKGDMELVGTIPESALKLKLAGLSLSETVNVLREYKSIIKINESSGQVIPPWSKVPSNPERITVQVLTK